MNPGFALRQKVTFETKGSSSRVKQLRIMPTGLGFCFFTVWCGAGFSTLVYGLTKYLLPNLIGDPKDPPSWMLDEKPQMVFFLVIVVVGIFQPFFFATLDNLVLEVIFFRWNPWNCSTKSQSDYIFGGVRCSFLQISLRILFLETQLIFWVGLAFGMAFFLYAGDLMSSLRTLRSQLKSYDVARLHHGYIKHALFLVWIIQIYTQTLCYTLFFSNHFGAWQHISEV